MIVQYADTDSIECSYCNTLTGQGLLITKEIDPPLCAECLTYMIEHENNRKAPFVTILGVVLPTPSKESND